MVAPSRRGEEARPTRLELDVRLHTSKEITTACDAVAARPYTRHATPLSRRRSSTPSRVAPSQALATMAVGKKTKTSKAKAPAKTSKKVTKIKPPRAAKSAFIHYCEATRDEIKAAHPDFSLGDVGRKLTKDWKALDMIAKKPFLEAALKDKKRFDAEKAAYDATPEGAAALAKQAAHAKQQAERERAKKSRKRLARARRALENRPRYDSEDDEDYVDGEDEDEEEAPCAKKPRVKAPAKEALVRVRIIPSPPRHRCDACVALSAPPSRRLFHAGDEGQAEEEEGVD